MRFIYVQVVDAHLPEIGHVIRPFLYLLIQLFQFGLKVLLPSFQPLLYPAAHFIAPCRSNTARFSSILFISCVYISCCISGDWGIFHRLGYAGHRIMQRVFEQVAYVIPSFFSFHKIFVRDVRIAFLEVHTELVDGFRIGEYNPTLSGRIPDYAWSYT